MEKKKNLEKMHSSLIVQWFVAGQKQLLCAVKDEMIWRDEVFVAQSVAGGAVGRCFLQLATTYDVQTVEYIFIFKS